VPRVPLSELIQLLPEVRLAGASDVRVWVTDVAYDSRKVEPGALFVAIPGQQYDGHDFVTDAVARGAVAVVVERPVEVTSVPVLQVPHAREALALLANGFYGFPSRRLLLVGVTGTNGKIDDHAPHRSYTSRQWGRHRHYRHIRCLSGRSG
jgi:UDP-N-acetylmuramoyl-L-alanyl-D-glutamate--2,6-diaminopimelate ligase